MISETGGVARRLLVAVTIDCERIVLVGDLAEFERNLIASNLDHIIVIGFFISRRDIYRIGTESSVLTAISVLGGRRLELGFDLWKIAIDRSKGDCGLRPDVWCGRGRAFAGRLGFNVQFARGSNIVAVVRCYIGRHRP